MSMRRVRLSGLVSVTWATAGMRENLLLTCGVCRSASQI